MLIRRTWEKFVASLSPNHPEYKAGIEYWLGEHTKPTDEYGLRVPLSEFENQFEAHAHRCLWHFNQTPDNTAAS